MEIKIPPRRGNTEADAKCRDPINDESHKYSAKTVENVWLFFKAVLSENGISTPRVTLPQITSEERPYLSAEEVLVFVKSVKDSKCCIPALLALHSLRRSELLALDWDNVDLDNGLLYIRGAVVYNHDNRLV